MKPNVSMLILTVALLAMAAAVFITNRKHSNRQKENEAIETAKKDFLTHLGNKNAFIDSTYVHNDTLFFYQKGVFLGKTVVVTE
jgi:hypothetical protein